MSRHLRMLALGAALVLAAAPALAHSTVKSTVPVSGSVLTGSPAEVTHQLQRGCAHDLDRRRRSRQARAQAGLHARRAARRHSWIHDPGLGAGRNEIKWKALSKDGHPNLGLDHHRDQARRHAVLAGARGRAQGPLMLEVLAAFAKLLLYAGALPAPAQLSLRPASAVGLACIIRWRRRSFVQARLRPSLARSCHVYS